MAGPLYWGCFCGFGNVFVDLQKLLKIVQKSMTLLIYKCFKYQMETTASLKSVSFTTKPDI